MPGDRQGTVSVDSLRFVGHDLCRPECVLATKRGNLYVSDWRGGVLQIHADGAQTLFGGRHPVGEGPILPNGIALRRDGTFLVASLGVSGGVWSLDRSGEIRPFVLEVDGVPLPATNFVMIDHHERIWITVSTRKVPRSLDFQPDCAGGFVVLVDDSGARIVVEGVGYANEVHPSLCGRWLYINETYARRVARCAIRADGSLGPKEIVVEFGAGTFPDGLAIDADGCLWVTSVISNRVIRVTPNGEARVILEDAIPERLALVEDAYQRRSMGQQHVSESRGAVLRNVSSMAFGGEDLRTAYFGCLQGGSLATCHLDVAGAPPAHWLWD